MRTAALAVLTANLALAGLSAVRVIDFEDAAQRAAQPAFRQVSHACGFADFGGPHGRWCYRFQVTRPWCGELPQWPSVNLKPAVSDWTGYDRLVVDLFNDSVGGDVLCAFLSEADGRIQNGLAPRSLPLDDHGFHRWIIPLKNWPETTDPKKIGRVHFFMTTPNSANIYIGGVFLLKQGEPLPDVSESFMAEKVRPALALAEQRRQERRKALVAAFVEKCRAAGQSGKACWVGKATGMEKVRPREGFSAAPADAFALKLARSEYESLQVVVVPNGRDLKDVSVEIADLARDGGDGTLPAAAFKVSPVGYVNVTKPAPYRSGYNVATNLPGGYWRTSAKNELGWWPDPILDHLDRASVKDGDAQAFWVRLHCPDGQAAGTYRGKLAVRGEGWREEFPLSVRVWNFAVPKASPLPLAITFGPGPSLQFADDEQIALAKRLQSDPNSPVNKWKGHVAEWGSFLADYYITMDSLYHGGGGVQWDVLRRLKDEGRLGLFNLGYWSYPASLSDKAKDAWLANVRKRIGPTYAKAKELGLLDRAYFYGCDEVSSNYFPNIRWALAELRREFPGVPLSTTAYDRGFGVGTPLDGMDWFTPTTDMYEKDIAKIPASRAAGHQVWWYIACGQQAPRANLFVEGQAIEARQLMGAQTVKFRPQGFLYYQVSIWNSHRCIQGSDTFTDWDPRSWTRFHGDGSWFCCGPDGRPCATVRIENFRDGLEDYAYAREYERVTGKTAEVPPEVCTTVWQFSDDPAAVYAWRDAMAEAIERGSAR